ncbi:MAG TPA: asparagine synthase (glutamine-hydrolyzing) [Candidatus Kapabacteria bacterium]|nr:asparagine synthase (glutamine-hydrolyzing) [Candidatus Kapabacteria bacterium]
MCGIAGIYKTNQSKFEINDKLLKSMSDIIHHRGPDSDGVWLARNRNCGFSFRRLAILDLSENASQPMHTPDGRYTIVFNGEIYNHLELRKELIAKGYKYRSNSDTESILYGYAEWGEAILDKMIGMWAFAIYDEQTQELFAARDRMGIKPFYYYYDNGDFIFASEIKAILQYPNYHKDINFDELSNYLTFGATSCYSSIFSKINKLPSAHYLKINSQGNLEIKRYWNPFQSNINYSEWSEDEITKEIMRLLRDSVHIRMISDVPFGAFLSGGIDSSLNVALMSEFMDRPVDTFTVGFKDLVKYNELEYADLVSKIFKTNHHEIIIDHEMALPMLDEIAWHLDEPNADPVSIPIYFLSNLTRNEGTIMVLMGEGSDEQFIGYNWMLRDFKFHETYWKAYHYLPKLVRKFNFNIIKPLFIAKNQYLALDYLDRAGNSWEQYWSGIPMLTNQEILKLLNDKSHYRMESTHQYAKSLHNLALQFNSNADYSQRSIFLELTQRLPEMLLDRVDKMGMANSIEARVPFLDHRLVEMTSTLNLQKKIPDKHTTKYLLKKASKGVIPDEIIYRKKQGFSAPMSEWLRNEWYDYAKDKIDNSYLVREGIFNKQFIDRIMQTHRSGKVNFSKEIYSLLSLSLWQEQFL